MKYIFGYGGSTIGPGPTGNHQCRTNDRINNSFHPVPTIQHTTSQIPELPKVNFNVFNLGSTENTHFSFEPINDKFKINYKKESNLIAMLKNKEIDSVDSKSFNGLSKKAHRHRTLSIWFPFFNALGMIFDLFFNLWIFSFLDYNGVYRSKFL